MSEERFKDYSPYSNIFTYRAKCLFLKRNYIVIFVCNKLMNQIDVFNAKRKNCLGTDFTYTIYVFLTLRLSEYRRETMEPITTR